MEVGGYDTHPDTSRLGTALLVGACVILAVRTARWQLRTSGGTASDRSLDEEVEHSVTLAGRVLAHLLCHKASYFPAKRVPWYVATEEDVPR